MYSVIEKTKIALKREKSAVFNGYKIKEFDVSLYLRMYFKGFL